MSQLRPVRPSELEIPPDPLDWRPQLPRPTRVPTAIKDAILEPHWSGVHVLAHFDSERPGQKSSEPWLRLIDELGEDATADEPAVVDELTRSVLAVDAVLDGYLTEQATRGGEGASVSLQANVSRIQPILPSRAEIDIRRGGSEPQGNPVAFVAVDLLRLDGQLLLDVPLLERKRLLESVIAPTALVRISPYTRPPIRQWLVSWKSAGFAGIVAKGANSRYRPAGLTEEWAVYTKLR